MIPKMRETLSCNPTKPVYGVSLEEHLRVTNRDIAQVLEACICFLLETGLDEEVILIIMSPHHGVGGGGEILILVRIPSAAV